MTYKVKYPLPGFEKIEEVTLEQHDGLTTILKSENDSTFKLSLINASTDKKYFEIPIGIKTLLDLNDNTNFSVYFTVIIEKNIHDSTINLGAPIIFNEDNNTTAQCVINNDSTTLRELDFIDLPSLNITEKYNLKISNLISDL
mgnify:CR=1 FL=1